MSQAMGQFDNRSVMKIDIFSYRDTATAQCGYGFGISTPSAGNVCMGTADDLTTLFEMVTESLDRDGVRWMLSQTS